MLEPWPEYKEKYNFTEELRYIEELKEVIVNIRNIRANMNVHPSKKTKLIFVIQKDVYIYFLLLYRHEGFLNGIPLKR